MSQPHRMPGGVDCLDLARAVGAHLPARPGRTWRSRREPDVTFRGHEAASVGDGQRSLLLAALPEGVALAPWPAAGGGFAIAGGAGALPERLTKAAVRSHLPRLDAGLVRALSEEQQAKAAGDLLRDLAAAVPGRFVRHVGRQCLVLDLPGGRLTARVDPLSLEVALTAGPAGTPGVGAPPAAGSRPAWAPVPRLGQAPHGLRPLGPRAAATAVPSRRCAAPTRRGRGGAGVNSSGVGLV
ncbi:hypothetical protein ABT093_19880 [Kitasatospora sp. NPDC002551]|uniref:hypothetical protein n=1 Tax=Kitasatospora sp. NPDC002551 TaxID=3154539 RepID=UPI00332CCEA4